MKEDQDERRFIEEFACSVGEAYDETNGGSSYGGAAWFNRMAVLL